MKVVIPTNGNLGLEDDVADHFGRSQTYTSYDMETGDVKVIRNESEHMGGLGKPPANIISEGANVVICKGLGRRAVKMFEDAGVKVYCGASGKVKDAVRQYREEKLELATQDNSCDRHAFRSEKHDHNGCRH